MTIDEAIIQFKEDAEYNRADLDLEWAEENEQVARWLEELKDLREYKGKVEWVIKTHKQIKTDAIEECISTLKESYPLIDSYGFSCAIHRLEQLKENK